LVVKATLLQLPKVDAWATAQGWRSADVDLVITAGQVSDFDPEMFDDYVRGAISDRVRAPRSWRTLTLASSAAPKDYSAFPVGRTEVPRLDWSLWNTVHASFEFQLDYGDHGTVHPDLTEPPGVAMVRASVSVRYTLNHHWIIQKGHATTGARGQPMARQYLAHARALVADPQFGGVANCWGDDRILQIAAGATTSGSRATWVANSMNRHLSLVADRLP
jgi:hypothetical protein